MQRSFCKQLILIISITTVIFNSQWTYWCLSSIQKQLRQSTPCSQCGNPGCLCKLKKITCLCAPKKTTASSCIYIKKQASCCANKVHGIKTRCCSTKKVGCCSTNLTKKTKVPLWEAYSCGNPQGQDNGIKVFCKFTLPKSISINDLLPLETIALHNTMCTFHLFSLVYKPPKSSVS